MEWINPDRITTNNNFEERMDMQTISRRKFLSMSTAALLSTAAPCQTFSALAESAESEDKQFRPADISGKVFKNDAPKKLWKWSHKGFAFKKLANNKVICGICPNRCILAVGDRSVCRSKVNIDGTLYTLTYGNPCAVNIDPIEKKPLFHFKPKTKVLSIATTGCNFRCLNCQNWQISQVNPESVRHYDLFPRYVIKRAKAQNINSIAYTYSEATTYFEYMMDTAELAKKNKISNLWISNGYINQGPLIELCKVLDAANVNLKAFSDSVYRKLNGGRLEPVLNTFKTMHEQNLHFEITNLVVPGYTDDPDIVKDMCSWILNSLGPDYPLHFLRFFPQYKLDRLPPTPVSTLTKFRNLALEAGIRYVYVGNIPGHEGNNTYCHNCHKMLIKRDGYYIPEYNLKGDRCKFCNTVIPGVWS